LQAEIEKAIARDETALAEICGEGDDAIVQAIRKTGLPRSDDVAGIFHETHSGDVRRKDRFGRDRQSREGERPGRDRIWLK
jgi:hypothetical protein